MRRIGLLVAIVFCCSFIHAQQKQYVYCELIEIDKLISNKIVVRADFGQRLSFWKGIDYLRDEKGKKMVFNSMIDAMNFMGAHGWEFVQVYTVTVEGKNVYRWVLKKEITPKQKKEQEEIFIEE